MVEKKNVNDTIKDIIDKSYTVTGLFDKDTLAEFTSKTTALAMEDVSYLLKTNGRGMRRHEQRARGNDHDSKAGFQRLGRKGFMLVLQVIVRGN